MKYYFDLEGEDHTRFVWECEAYDKRDALSQLSWVYPDAHMLNMQSHQEYIEAEQFRYERIAYEMDNDYQGNDWL